MDFNTALLNFLNTAEKKVNDYRRKHYPSLGTVEIAYTEGSKFIRVYKQDGGSRSLYCWIDKETGRIWKGSWKAPERKNPRGSIFDSDGGAAAVNHYGTVYLR